MAALIPGWMFTVMQALAFAGLAGKQRLAEVRCGGDLVVHWRQRQETGTISSNSNRMVPRSK